MIALDDVHARSKAGARAFGSRPPTRLTGVTLRWARGVLAVVGAPHDGTALLLAVASGAVSPRSGLATIDGRPAREARANVALVAIDAALPEALRVDEVCDLAAELRGEPARSPAERLAPLGLEGLARRRVRSLSPGEARGVSLAIALTSHARAILVDEPLSAVEPTVPARVVELVRARARDGAAILVTTASVRDATRLADELAVLTQGALVTLPPGLAHVGREGARLRVVVRATGLAPLLAAFADEPAITSVEAQSQSHTLHTHAVDGAASIVVGGAELLSLAGAVGRAVARTRVDVEAIESAVMPLDAIRAALARPRPGALHSVPPASMPSSGGAP